MKINEVFARVLDDYEKACKAADEAGRAPNAITAYLNDLREWRRTLTCLTLPLPSFLCERHEDAFGWTPALISECARQWQADSHVRVKAIDLSVFDTNARRDMRARLVETDRLFAKFLGVAAEESTSRKQLIDKFRMRRIESHATTQACELADEQLREIHRELTHETKADNSPPIGDTEPKVSTDVADAIPPTKTSGRDQAVRYDESPKNTKVWPIIAKQMTDAMDAGKPFGSYTKWEKSTGRSRPVLVRAVKSCERLVEWAKRQINSPSWATQTEEHILANVTASIASCDAEIIEPSDLEKSLATLLESASDDERKKIAALPPDKQRALAEIALKDAEVSEQIYRRKQAKKARK